MNRREALRTIGTGGTVGLVAAVAFATTTQCAPTPAPAADADPILPAIDAHRTAYEGWQAIEDEDDPRLAPLDTSEQVAWARFCAIVPTSLYGLARMASYMQRHLTCDTYPPDETIEEALLSIAAGAAALDAKARRTT